MMQDPQDFIPVALEAGLSKDWFYSPAHGILWERLRDLFEREKPIELISFTQALKDDDVLDNIGGPSEITSIYTYAPTAAHFEHHLEVVKSKWFRRGVLAHCRRMSAACYDQEDDVVESLLVKPVEDLLESVHNNKEIATGRDALSEWLDDWKGKHAGTATLDIAESGTPLDDIRQGLDCPGLCYIGAFPSMGKTAMLVQMAIHRLRMGDRVLLFSMEMTRRQLITRAMMQLCRFRDPQVLLDPEEGTVTKEEMLKIRDAAAVIASDNLIIDDRSGLTIEQIEARAKLEHRKGKLGFIGVDYLQLIVGKGDSREQSMTHATHGLQRIMKSTRASVVGLSQLTMDERGRTHFKYARSLEEDADLAIRIEGSQEEKRVEGMRITKDRQRGHVGYYPKVRFDKSCQTFWRES